MRRFFLGLALAAALALPAAAQPLRVVMNLELQVLDPIITTSNVTRAYAYLVFDTLISMDSEGRYHPQMLEGWESSPDGLTWTFRLRPGLAWHDGAPVTAEDCVASLRRWGRRDGLGSRLMAASRGLRVVDERTFVLELAQPFSQVIEAIGKPAAQIPFMMPARMAATDPTRPVTETVGSGPYTFSREEWRPGDRAIFRRNPAYRPRPEPANGLAGGKVAHLDRIDFVSLPDPATRVAALQAGEADYVEYVPTDFIARLSRDRNIRLVSPRPIAQIMGAIAINHIHPPFDKPILRRALQQALDQGEILAGLGLPSSMTLPWCQSIFMCGGPYASEAGTEALRQPGLERARALLREGGYANEPVVFLHSTDSVTINPMALVIIDRLQRAGFNVDVVASDYSSQAQRRLSREPPGRGGWSLMPVVFTGFDILNPLAHYAVAYNCTNNYPGWYCDPTMTPLVDEFAREPDAKRRLALAGEIQRHVHENGLMAFTGQFSVPAAHRAEIDGVLPVGFPVFWNMRRAGR
ncbi:ABC transporter substrate-binding protein [Belnapia sp. T6]|uniref:ABC transporter substrate-binding protein n=1 Tax=Belnapia mucosa TaxID=2804532 RepID=A0ABS1V1S6_9PROT|nr:ABC transporter substrate-binding protein [Belnapia mucosa]MBL6454253.1 ABC transporter substrate-binding protein [Belnapia mucosa]